MTIHDDFLEPDLLSDIKNYCRGQIATVAPAGRTYSLINQSITQSQGIIMQQLYPRVEAAAMAHCAETDVEWDNLRYQNCQLGFLRKFNQQVSMDAFHEPHHDMAENVYINTILYVESDYDTTDQWVGGELILYKDLSCGQFPKNTVRIRPLENRLIVFSAFNIHRVNPYFGDTPRTAIINCWGLDDLSHYANRIL